MIILVVSEKINKSNSFTSILFISNFESMDFLPKIGIFITKAFCTNLENNFLFVFLKFY